MKLDGKFWTIVIDAVVSAVAVVVTAFLAPDYAKLVITLVGILQPVVIALVAAIYGENVERIRAASNERIALKK